MSAPTKIINVYHRTEENKVYAYSLVSIYKIKQAYIYIQVEELTHDK